MQREQQQEFSQAEESSVVCEDTVRSFLRSPFRLDYQQTSRSGARLCFSRGLASPVSSIQSQCCRGMPFGYGWWLFVKGGHLTAAGDYRVDRYRVRAADSVSIFFRMNESSTTRRARGKELLGRLPTTAYQ